MPYTDREKHKRVQRNSVRTKRHGHWRHIIDYWNGLCVVCGENLVEELHEPFGEDHYNEGRFQARVPMCRVCHNRAHRDNGWRGDPENRVCHISMYITDIESEIKECGSHEAWRRKYKVPHTAPVFQGRIML